MITDTLSDTLVIKTLAGLEDVLARECEQAGLGPAHKQVRAVVIPNRNNAVIRANMALRTALRVLVPLAEFELNAPDEIYDGARQVRWSLFIKPEHSFRLQHTVKSKLYRHSGYAVLKVKDALCDQVREACGERPSVDKVAPDWIVDVHVWENKVHLSLDTSGVPLYKRGWKMRQGAAPLNEVLAAGLIYLADWNSEEEDFFDLMCGSGTLVAEAADIAANKAPGLHGRAYAFMGYPGFDVRVHQKVKRDLAACQRDVKVKIWGSDVDGEAVKLARLNLASAGHADDVFIQKADFRKLPLKPEGLIILNPPYDKRLSVPSVKKLYQDLGRFLKHHCTGSRAGILTGHQQGLQWIGLKPYKTFVLLNGSLPCEYALYTMFEGKRKEFLKLQNEQGLP
jgi:putative N6-adenine-specific DNA methylase